MTSPPAYDATAHPMPQVRVTRFVTPLREGGSLPGLVEGADLGTYVCKFRGAGQGLRVLVAEVIVTGIAEALDLRTPRLVELELCRDIARYEADEEVQDLLTHSVGSNLGVDFLPGSFGFDPSVVVDPDWAATVLWLDAFIANVDRSWRNPNLLVWHREPWLIDHGASLYFHHGWTRGPGDPARFAAQRWDASDHVFEAHAARARELAPGLVERLGDDVIARAVQRVPEAWLADASEREAYVSFLAARRDAEGWLP
ncbi:hypothetical protein GCM10027425_12020 [Alteromonas gracilis]